jgi:hypothetical protein
MNGCHKEGCRLGLKGTGLFEAALLVADGVAEMLPISLDFPLPF